VVNKRFERTAENIQRALTMWTGELRALTRMNHVRAGGHPALRFIHQFAVNLISWLSNSAADRQR
jgi:hypothetical protein